MKIEIKHRYSGEVLFSVEAGSMRLAVEAAMRSGADLRGAYLGSADLRSAYLGGANLGGAYLGGANLGGANLRGANLGGANLRGADLRSADLRGADLRGAYLGSADLGGADLGGANLGGADLGGAKGINPHLVTPLLMLRDQPGRIRAYKLTTAEGEGPQRGGITYQVGAAYSVDNADTDETVDCGAGINLATMDWCLRNHRPGYRIFVAEFESKDIAAIPTANDGKFRVHRCRIVGEKDVAKLLGETREEAA